MNIQISTGQHYGAHEYHSLIINRIYHEDNLWSQRAYVRLGVQAFLMSAFVVLVAQRAERDTLMWGLAGALGAFGASLGIFQAAYGRQINRVIRFWREYAKLIELRSEIQFDHLQYEFYAKGSVQTPFGYIGKEHPRQRTLYQIFGERGFLTSMVSTVGVGFPACLAAFWAFVIAFAVWKLTQTPWSGIMVGLFVLALEAYILWIPLAMPKGDKRLFIERRRPARVLLGFPQTASRR